MVTVKCTPADDVPHKVPTSLEIMREPLDSLGREVWADRRDSQGLRRRLVMSRNNLKVT